MVNKLSLKNKTILITGAAGFIGANLVLQILKTEKNVKIIGLDNLNDYYDVSLKEYRLNLIKEQMKDSCNSWSFIKGDLSDKALITKLFQDFKPNIVINLARNLLENEGRTPLLLFKLPVVLTLRPLALLLK